MNRTYTGFGFGAIQSGLLLYEAFRSGNFSRLVVAEVIPEVIAAVREANGYFLNIATENGIEHHFIEGIEIYNPAVPAEAEQLVAALAESQEIGTALPSIDFFTRGSPAVADLLRKAFTAKLNDPALPDAVVYTAENNNHAAELLEKSVGLNLDGRVQFLNTVVGKMSGVATDEKQIEEDALARVTPAADRAFLVEEFNRILITKIKLSGFRRGIEVFAEKDDLLPFEEAKLYGHNAVHALIGYRANEKGCRYMSEVSSFPEITGAARQAFLHESGAALIKKYAGLDPLFTPDGFKEYADDLLKRMMNPNLRDQVERVIRDPRRKLGWNDRLIGTMRLAIAQKISPDHFAAAARAALHCLSEQENTTDSSQLLTEIWAKDNPSGEEEASVRKMIFSNQHP
ncbi:MAG: mannitol-phosphate 5-dehydrogenase [Verrucomicrobiota bacterium]|jgi:mannitol-1-phosphate 5-dehydrogenase|nr:mannitol-phosphate 5-dehydrogenase [Verrucomicrobiota bacterium]